VVALALWSLRANAPATMVENEFWGPAVAGGVMAGRGADRRSGRVRVAGAGLSSVPFRACPHAELAAGTAPEAVPLLQDRWPALLEWDRRA
jgi:hypothetical protein